MKKKLFLLLLPFTIFAQSEANPCEISAKLNAIIQSNHYRPKPVNDSLSAFVFDDFIQDLDPQNLIFTEKELKVFNKHRFQIDNYINDKNCNFLTEIYKTYTTAMSRYKNLIESIQKEPFLFSSTESVTILAKKYKSVADEAEMKLFLKKRILFNVLRDVASISKNKDSLTNNFDKLAKSSKAKVFENYLCNYGKLQIDESEFNLKFLNSFCSYFDPHTVYLSKNDKSRFYSFLNSDNFSFGLEVSQNDKQELIVQKVVPGSAAYFSEKISTGDQILEIKYLDKTYNVGCSDEEMIQKIFTLNEFKNADFYFRKKSGEQFTVSLSKKLLKDYDNTVYSYIIEKDKKKTGYIKIPTFYATFENGKTNVSEDVTKEIYKLKADKVNGLIIDLQDNGGGSLDEAIQLAGLFIDFGIVAITHTNVNKRIFLKDPNRGSIYDGPLVVLVNGSSASASEFFANAMQDYKRAIILGTTSFGKASMQQVFPLSTTPNSETFFKLTTNTFYRITGKTHQNTGLIPDVILPQLFENQYKKESSFRTALPNDTIEGVLQINEFLNPKRSDLIKESIARVKNSDEFKKITEFNIKIDKLFESNAVPQLLNFSAVFDTVNNVNSTWASVINFSNTKYDLKVYQSKQNEEYQEFDEFLKSSNTEKTNNLKRNLAALEAVNIINKSN